MLLILKRAPVAKDGECPLVEHDGVTLAGLAVLLHDDLVLHTRHRPGKRSSPRRRSRCRSTEGQGWHLDGRPMWR